MLAVTVVGIGADGWPGLAEPARAAIRGAGALLGGARQLDLLPAEVPGERVAWPSPMLAALPGLVEAHRDRGVCVLASGDPMFYGVGATLVRLLGAEAVRVVAHPSSVALACARLGWPAEEVEVVSVVGRPVERLHPAVQPGRRLLVLSADADSPAAVAALLTARGYAGSALTVCEQLGGPAERLVRGTAAGWAQPAGHPPAADPPAAAPPAADPPAFDPLNVVAVECVAGPDAVLLPTVPGLPDGAYDHDGQLTKREIRAITLARLAPVAGQLLWDVGGGAGSIAIEWMRTHPSCRAFAVESDPDRAARIGRNAAALGVPGLRVVEGAAPAALTELPPPEAVFVGGGATVPGVVDRCWDALAPGGRLVVNAVTMESERVVFDWYARLGGELTRIAVNRASPVGGFTAWRAMMPVTQWVVTKR